MTFIILFFITLIFSHDIYAMRPREDSVSAQKNMLLLESLVKKKFLDNALNKPKQESYNSIRRTSSQSPRNPIEQKRLSQ